MKFLTIPASGQVGGLTTCSEGTRVLPRQTCRGDFGQYPGDRWDESSALIGRENQETESIVHKLT